MSTVVQTSDLGGYHVAEDIFTNSVAFLYIIQKPPFLALFHKVGVVEITIIFHKVMVISTTPTLLDYYWNIK